MGLTLCRELGLSTQGTIGGFYAYISRQCHIRYGSCTLQYTRRDRHKLLRPDIVANTQRDTLANLDIFQRNPLIRPDAELVFFCSLQDKTAPGAQANRGCIPTDVPIDDIVSFSAPAANPYCLALGQQLM